MNITPQEHIELCIRNNFDILTSAKRFNADMKEILKDIGYNAYVAAIKIGGSSLEATGKMAIVLYATRNNTEQERKIIFNNITLL